MKQTLAIVFVALNLTACQKSDVEISPPSVPAALTATAPASAAASSSTSVADLIVIQTSSPDQAVKTWWRYIDLIEIENNNECKKMLLFSANHLTYLPRVSDGEVLAARTPKKDGCEADVFAREIDEVKTESETRAVVFSTIKNASPIPIGAEADDLDKKWRAAGFKFKYLVEKIGQEWKVTQVYRYDETNRILKKDPWEKLYKGNDKPRVPAYVPPQ